MLRLSTGDHTKQIGRVAHFFGYENVHFRISRNHASNCPHPAKERLMVAHHFIQLCFAKSTYR